MDWTHRKEHFYRALLESFSFELALTIDSIERNYPEYQEKACKLIGRRGQIRALGTNTG